LQAVKTPKIDAPDIVRPQSLAGLRVLLAEDHPTNQRVVSIILEPQGVDLTIVDDGAKAVEAFINGSFDLVLMDLQMPVMDGLEAIRRIRDVERTEGLRPTLISVLSANVAAEHKRLALEAGADGHIGKPFTPATLVGPITDLMRRRSDH
jgi:CheY-like chemotaxis protein